MYKGHTILAVIPARAGSKGIPNKNFQKINGKTLIEHSIDCARACDIFDAVVTTSDIESLPKIYSDIDIKELFLSDKSDVNESWKVAWTMTEKEFKKPLDFSCLLEPTSPLRRFEDVLSCLGYLIDGNFDTMATISSIPKAANPHKIISLQGGKITFPFGFNPHRQNAPEYYRVNGACYAAKRGFIDIFSNCGYVIIDRDLVNVDEPIDLEYARYLASKAPAEKIC